MPQVRHPRFVKKRLFGQKTHEHGGQLGASRAVLSLEAVAVAGDDLLADGPLHRSARVARDPVGVGESAQILLNLRLARAAVKQRGDLLTGDGRVRLKGRLARAVGDLLLERPNHGVGVILAGLDVRECYFWMLFLLNL